MIQKKIEKKFFLSKFQNGPIRKVNMLKSKFDDIFVPAPLCHHGSALRKFFDQKENQNFFFSSTQNGPIRKVNRLKSKFDDIFVHEIFIKKLNILHCYLILIRKKGKGWKLKTVQESELQMKCTSRICMSAAVTTGV